MKTLSKLLNEVDALFGDVPDKLGGYTHTVYELCRTTNPEGWSFNVIDNWNKWSAVKLKHDFGIYPSPELALTAFLNYVSDHKINVKDLRSND